MGKAKTFPSGEASEFIHWVKAAGFTVTAEGDFYCYAKKSIDAVTRQIRLDRSRDVFELCDGDFDRWANSVGATGRFPYSEKAFGDTLAALLKETAPGPRQRRG